jgi:hypothetical protein
VNSITQKQNIPQARNLGFELISLWLLPLLPISGMGHHWKAVAAATAL